jgi:hypothetical protein
MSRNAAHAVAVFWLLSVSTLFTFAIWYPFGFSLGPLVEEWGILEMFASQGPTFLVHPGSAFSGQSIRPLTVLPQAIAYSLDPSSFRFWHILLIVSLIIKGAAAGYLGLFVSGRIIVATFLALLTLAYPADTMQLSPRMIHLNWALALALAAAALALCATEVMTKIWRLLLSFSASVLLTAGILMYEVVAGLALLPFLALFAARGLRNTLAILRHQPLIFLPWLAGLSFCAIHVTAMWLIIPSYHREVVGNITAAAVFDGWRWHAVLTALHRGFIESWGDIASVVRFDLTHPLYPLLMTVLLAGALFLISLRQRSLPLQDKGRPWRTALAGIIAFLLGYLPFLASPSHVMITQRTFLAAAFGAALVFAAGIVFLERVAKPIVVAMTGAFILGAAFIGQLYQFDRYNRLFAEVLRPNAGALARAAAGTPAERVPVIMNKGGYLTGVWDLGLVAKSAVRLVTGSGRELVICEAATGRRLPRPGGPMSGRQSCETEHPLTWHLRSPGVITPPETALTDVELRHLRLLTESTWTAQQSLFQGSDGRSAYRCTMDSMWGYAFPCRTYGMFEAEPFRPHFRTISAAWIGEKRAGFLFELQPARSQYGLTIRLVRWLPGASQRFQLYVNDFATNHQVSADGLHITATLPSNLVKVGANRIEIRSEPHPDYGVSALVREVVLRPLIQQ